MPTYTHSRPTRRAWGVVGLLCLALLFLTGPAVQAQTPPPEAPVPTATDAAILPGQEMVQETLEARVLSATPPQPCAPDLPPDVSGPGAPPNQCQRVELLITAGSLAGQTIVVEEGRLPIASKAGVSYQRGDRVYLDWNHGPDQPDTFYITDFIRTDSLQVLVIVFLVLSVVLGGWRGLTSLIGLGISLLVVLYFILPRIVAGDDPVLISIVGAVVIMVVTLYLSHGLNRKTTAAIAGTTISLVITGLLAWFAVDLTRLSGFGSEEAIYVQIAAGGAINLRGLLLGSIIIGALGVLDDITIGQAAAAFELHNVNPALTWRRLFGHTINIGRDHIAATVNTLVLAYAGASLPLLILFVSGDEPWSRVINREIVAEEVVRTLVGSIGLIAAVPITTLIASLLAARSPVRPPAAEDAPVGHVHHHH